MELLPSPSNRLSTWLSPRPDPRLVSAETELSMEISSSAQSRIPASASAWRSSSRSRAALLFQSLGRGAPEDWLFPSNKRNGPLTRQGVAARMARWGKAADVHLYPHRCRHTHATHAIRRGVDVFTLSATLGHSSTGTTSNYVLAEPGESSSLKLG